MTIRNLLVAACLTASVALGIEANQSTGAAPAPTGRVRKAARVAAVRAAARAAPYRIGRPSAARSPRPFRTHVAGGGR